MTKLEDEPQVVQDIIHRVDNDLYMWIPIWGEARTGKSTLAMSLMYKVYKDWDDVLGAIVFDLNGLLYKIRKGEPKLFPTQTEPRHMRVPIVLWDDFAAKGGKAQTQHEKAWDLFKGSFDTLGTRLGVLLATMVNPRSPTQQLLEKYTHEIMVTLGPSHTRLFKYDKCKSQQDFYGWKARQNKEWLEEQEFGRVPLDVFKQYDEMRTDLVDEVLVSMQDAMVEDTLGRLMKRVEAVDYQLIGLIKQKGPIHHRIVTTTFGEKGRKALTRCKARGLITPVRRGQAYYVYDVTDLGLDLLNAHEAEGKDVKNITDIPT